MSDHLIHVPETIEGVSRLLKARKWEKAAIVWAYVHSFENGEVGRGIAVSSDSYGKPYTPESFAHLGIAGLLSKNTVQAYWENWQAAIDAKKAKPEQIRLTLDLVYYPLVARLEDMIGTG